MAWPRGYDRRTTFRGGHASRWAALALAIAAGSALVATLGRPGAAAAGTDNVILTVNLTSDEPDANTGDNSCDSDVVAGGAQCTLRAAIQQANAFSGTDPDLIRFGIPGDGVHRIVPSSFLPSITGPTRVDGYTEEGASVNTRRLGKGDNAEIRIELSGTELDSFSGSGLRFAAGSNGSTVRGLCINRFATGLILETPTTVAGNFIGTNPAGTRDRGNTFDGVFGNLLGQRVIGGPDPASRNVISGNGRGAIVSNAAVVVQGNYIGVASDGASPLGNETNQDADAAVLLASDNVGNTVGGPGNTANVIAFNGGRGVALLNDGTVAHISRNRIYKNRGLGIDLGDDGRTPNDSGDGDAGPNRLLNFPELKRAVTGRRRTRIVGVYRSFPAEAPYGIELFANPRRTRQAQRFIDSVMVETADSGMVRFSLSVRRVAPGKTITATAIDDGGATSELSAPVRVRKR